jgi:hypothetical protein
MLEMRIYPSNCYALNFIFYLFTEGYELRCKVIKSVHYCKATNDQFIRNYSDLVSLSGKKTATVYPKTVIDFLIFASFSFSVIAFGNLFFRMTLEIPSPPNLDCRFTKTISE